MHSNDDRDKLATLASMAHVALDRSLANQIEAKQRFKEWLSYDKRFDGSDKNALVDRVMLCRSNGAKLELDDPTLRGREKRPLDRSNW